MVLPIERMGIAWVPSSTKIRCLFQGGEGGKEHWEKKKYLSTIGEGERRERQELNKGEKRKGMWFYNILGKNNVTEGKK